MSRQLTEQEITDLIDYSLMESIGEYNDSITREDVQANVVFHLIKANQEDFVVTCDGTNNDPEIVNSRQLRVSVKTPELTVYRAIRPLGRFLNESCFNYSETIHTK